MSDVQKNEIASILGAEFSQNPPKEEKIKDNLPQLGNKSGDDIVNEMDAQDGKVDGLIRFEIWNPFAKKVGGKEIKYVIAKENALKSINYYLKKANNEIVEKTTVSNNDKMIKQNDGFFV